MDEVDRALIGDSQIAPFERVMQKECSRFLSHVVHVLHHNHWDGAVMVFAPGSSCYLLLCTYYAMLLLVTINLILTIQLLCNFLA
jgi:hypothetical protein